MKPKKKNRTQLQCPIFTAEHVRDGMGLTVWFEEVNEVRARAYCKEMGWTLVFLENQRAIIDGGQPRTIRVCSEERPEKPLKVEVKYVKP